MNSLSSQLYIRPQLLEATDERFEVMHYGPDVRQDLVHIKSTLTHLIGQMQLRLSERAKDLRGLIEDEAGLKIPKYSTCPMRVIPLNPSLLSLALQKRRLYVRSVELRGAEAQIEALVWLAGQSPLLAQGLGDLLRALAISQRDEHDLFESPTMYQGHLDHLLAYYERRAIPTLRDELRETLRALLGVDLMEYEMPAEDVFRDDREVEVIDPLGVYRHTRFDPYADEASPHRQCQPSIEIYFFKVALSALRHGVTQSGLARCVYAHELAHWVSHLGYDSDNHWWETFDHESKDVIESTAQDLTLRALERAVSPYYTALERARFKAQVTLHAFQRLNAHQPPRYQLHTQWSGSQKQSRRIGLQVYRGTKRLGDFTQLDELINELNDVRNILNSLRVRAW